MGGGPYFFTMPAVVRVWLTGTLSPWVTAKDVILELLRRLSVRGGSGKIFEYAGPGLASLLARPAHDDRQHGRRADPDHQRLPERRDHALVSCRASAASRTGAAPRPTTTRRTTTRSSWTSRPSARWWLSRARPTVWCPSQRSPGRRRAGDGGLLHQRLVARHGLVTEVVRGRRVHPSIVVRPVPGQPPDSRDDGARGTAGRPAGRRRHGLRADLRRVRRNRSRARQRGQEPARLQPQLLRAQRGRRATRSISARR